MTVIAFPQSRYHLNLLIMNRELVDLLLIKSDSPLMNQVVLGGCEVLPFRCDLFSKNIFRAFADNRRAYAELKDLMRLNNVKRVILFNDAKPYHRFIIDRCLENNIEVELWEDGLSYYIGLGAPIKYILTNVAKATMGCYVRGALSEQYRRNEISARDRFINRNLNYKAQSENYSDKRQRIAFIGQSLVEDGYVGLRRYLKRIEGIADQTGFKVDYFPHPRETRKVFNPEKVVVMDGVAVEDWLSCVKYTHCSTAFSTAMLNIGAFQSRSFCAGYFGLRSIRRALKEKPIFGVDLLDGFEHLRSC